MKYSVDIERDIDSLATCIQRVNNGINNVYDWRISINAGGIDYGIYFNFDINHKELEISNQPNIVAEYSLCLDEIIEIINNTDEEDYE